MAPPSYETLDWSFDDETGIARLTLGRPGKMNALSASLREAIVDGFQRLLRVDHGDDDRSVGAVIVEGAGDRAFCAGADVNEFDSREPVLFDDDARVYQVCRRFPAPVIAKVDGYCLGGGVVLAVSCDFRLASPDSEFGLPEVEYGIVPGGGFVEQLVGLVGVSRAKELLMTGARLPATRAEAIGLVDHVHPSDVLEARAVDLATTLSEADHATIRTVKDLGNMAAGLDPIGAYEDRTTQWHRGQGRY